MRGINIAVFLIGEVGSVHDGSFGNAKCAVDVAAECGVDAVKFQLHIAEAETLPNAPAPPYFKAEPRMAYFRRTSFSKEQWRELKSYTEGKGLVFLCSPFSLEAVAALEDLGIAMYKVPSGEVTNLPLLRAIADTGKPVLLSSGMSSWGELDAAVDTVVKSHTRLTVLQCTSEYPCAYERVGLNVMTEMKERYGLPVGLSDHTLTVYAPLAATVLGASAIEKHFTMSRRMYGSDAKHSLEPNELADMVRGVRAVETMVQSRVAKDDVARFSVMKETFQKSIVAVVDISSGAVIRRDMLGLKKPGTGIPPARLEDVVGKTAKVPIAADSLIVWRELG